MRHKTKKILLTEFIEKEDTLSQPTEQVSVAAEPAPPTQTAAPKVYLQFGADVFELFSAHVVRHQRSVIKITRENQS